MNREMQGADMALMVLLAALWGGSFLFMRVAVPEFGAIALVFVRVLLGGVLLYLILFRRGLQLDVRREWPHYLALGALFAAVPYSLFSWATLHVTASLASIINATTPIFGALFAALFAVERATLGKSFGMLLGFLGTAVLVGLDLRLASPKAGLAIAACFLAAACYAAGTIYTKRVAQHLAPKSVAAGSLFGAATLLALTLPWNLPATAPSAQAWAAALALAIGSSAIAFWIYFSLVERLGAVKPLVVTFLIPVFGVLWGVIFLGEHITPNMLVGAAIVLVGVAFTTGLVKLPTRKAPRPA